MTVSHRVRPVVITLMCILVLGAILRFHGLGVQSLWNDELSSWARSSHSSLSQVLHYGAIPDVHPPLYRILLYGVEKVFGDSETMLRLPSALAGIASILLVFFLGRRVYSDREGIIAALLMSVLWFPLYYSQEARGYSLLMLGAIGSMHAFFGLFDAVRHRQKSRWRTLAVFVLWAIFNEYLHYFGLVLSLLQCLSLVLYAIAMRSPYKRIHVACGIVIACFLPWVFFLLQQISTQTGTASYIQRPGARFPIYYLYFICGKSKLLFGAFGLVIVAALIPKIASIARRQKPRPMSLSAGFFSVNTGICICWFILPMAAMYLVSYISSPLLTFRNMVICLPPVYLLLSRCIAQVFSNNRHLVLASCLFAALSLYDLLSIKNYYNVATKSQFREAVASIVVRDATYPRSVIIGCAYGADYFNYYFVKMASAKRVSLLAQSCGDTTQIDSVVTAARAKYVWFVWTFLPPESCIVPFLERKYRPIDHRQFLDADVSLYSCDNPAHPNSGSQ